jgi:curli biogenesis system outer membrane secretion channel CsgG
MKALALLLPLALLTAACATERSRVVETPTVASYQRVYDGPLAAAAIGRFTNASPYMRGIFSDGQDRLGNQAKTILQTHLAQTGRFDMLDRDNLDELALESSLSSEALQLEGARIVFTGEVTEFGRRTTGDTWLFGILSRGKRQTAYSKVSLNVVDARTGQVLHAVQGAGEFSLSDREAVGFGSQTGYDTTLNGKVLNLAITNAVDKLVADLESGAFRVQ